MKKIKGTLLKILWFIFLSGIISSAWSQTDRFKEIEKKLTTLSVTMPAMEESVDVSVSGVSIQEFLRAVANNAKINISVDPTLNINIVNNFSNVRVIDMLMFMAKEFDLEINVIGTIITVSKYQAPKEEVKIIPKKLNIKYISANDQLSVDLTKDTLVQVAKEITRQSGKNIILASSLNGILINGFVQDKPFDQVMEMLAYSNDLSLTKNSDGFYILDKKEIQKIDNKSTGDVKKNRKSTDASILTQIFSLDSINISVVNAPIIDLIKEVSDKLHINYSIVSPIDGTVDMAITGMNYDEFLNNVLNGTEFTYRKNGNIYVLGEQKVMVLKESEVIQLQYRTVDKIMEIIPADVKKDVEIKEFPELNSLLVTGISPKVQLVKAFIRSIDKVVPVVLIEVMIVDVTKKHITATGISTGIADNSQVKTAGSIFPGIDMTFSTSTINNLINSFNGFGWFNLGHVTPNFYLSIKALEDNGVLHLRSTPKMSTLNGHEATLSIGKTEYYMEEQNNVVGTQNPQNITTRTYKSINADLSITIKPIVSGDNQVTLEIKVKQSDFTARISPSAPPGSVTRNFESLIRIKNEEMVLLGGLEENGSSDSGTGVPLLSRIPIIKWVFSSRTKEKKVSKLNIFIKPTVIY
ncbi:MAG: general secretion pathway protein GspD [Bacteroidia bacterium]|nr:general secretion pathway protein GspD [Bacteroidia bacterium]